MKTDTHATRRLAPLFSFVAAACFVLSFAPVAEAQVTPAAGYTPPDDTPSIKVGATIFADYTYINKPTGTDAQGNVINQSSFNVARSYINITGNISHIIAFRITPDITRESGTGSSLNGSLTFRLKYAFMQINLDDWLPKGSWIRLGIQQTPFIDYSEGIYRYRYQGTTFFEREGFQSSADAGVSFHMAFPQNYGELHAGYYNGEGYSKAETNNEKGFMIRGTLRPLPMHPFLRGWRVTGYYTADHYVMNAPRTRAIFDTSFEHKYATVTFQYLDTHDQTSSTAMEVIGKGWSVYATPKFGTSGWELLLRHDTFTPDQTATTQVRDRNIFGIAYWFPHQGSVSAALMVDADTRTFTNINSPTDQRIYVHSLIAF